MPGEVLEVVPSPRGCVSFADLDEALAKGARFVQLGDALAFFVCLLFSGRAVGKRFCAISGICSLVY
jgi:hypothetical protein